MRYITRPRVSGRGSSRWFSRWACHRDCDGIRVWDKLGRLFALCGGDVFGSPLAIEAIAAFFLESTFLGVLIFGWNRIGKKTHFFSTCMVCLGSHLSAVWIIVANSWMQTPAGYHIVTRQRGGEGGDRQFLRRWSSIRRRSTGSRTLFSRAWITGAALVMAVAAYYLLRKRHEAFAKDLDEIRPGACSHSRRLPSWFPGTRPRGR